MKKLQYRLAWYDRKMGTVDFYVKMPMDGVDSGEPLPQFLQSAGEQGWLLCGVMDGYIQTGIRTVHANPEQFAKATGQSERTLTDPKEVIELVFVKEV
jgi:hypothetical protein